MTTSTLTTTSTHLSPVASAYERFVTTSPQERVRAGEQDASNTDPTSLQSPSDTAADRLLVAKGLTTDENTLLGLLADKCEAVRLAAAGNPNLPLSLLRILADINSELAGVYEQRRTAKGGS